MEKYQKDAFCVIGKMGSTRDGEGFVQRLWDEANAHFDEVAPLAVHQEDGTLAGIWGLMSDFSLNFQPWEEDFTQGLYLAGVEVRTDAIPPKGWKKWIIPGFQYLKAEVRDEHTFRDTLTYMQENNLPLVGAVQDFTDPETKKSYMLFPVEKTTPREI